MDNELLDITEKVLETHGEVILPIKKLWTILQFGDEYEGIEVPVLSEFTELLRSDERFEFMHPIDYTGVFSDLSAEERRSREIEMEEAGFFSGERVKLKRIALTGDVLARMIERSSERMMQALAKAWEAEPRDQKEEKRLLVIMEKAQQLQKDVQRIVEQLREKDVEGGLRD